ncbi:MAG TPA: carboxypeptidase regulatory-like domain-containing protein [Candidatus Binatia bacterium]|nr:carboxypeptidase regulatory-like domain-containing protein [Candidatus Binatia bacterium]
MLLIFFLTAAAARFSAAQASYTAQIRGTVTDQSGAVIAKANVTITNDATNISQTAPTDEHGQYFITGLRPASYTIKVSAPGFRVVEKKDVVLQVDQQTSMDVVLHPLGISETMEVTETPPLLDTDNATLGTDISNEYVKQIPLINRNFFGLTFLSGGVTEAAGSGTQDNYPSGTNFVSNGQRNATAEIRLDGALISAPEQGEGGNSNVYYEPLVESVQEFKVQNNSFSAEFGNNGGTVVNMVLKSGTNAFHGSGWYFLQRSQLDARDFFNPAQTCSGGVCSFNPKPDSKRDQGGFSLGGPIRKDKTFFFVDFEKVRSNQAFTNIATVPTLAERGMTGTGYDFSNTQTVIYDPKQVNCTSGTCMRPQAGFDINGNPIGPPNVIPANEVDPIGLAILKSYPQPNLDGEFNNYSFSDVINAPDYQFDIKIDHQINDKQHINGRYSRAKSNFTTPFVMGDAFDNGGTGDGIGGTPQTAHNASLEYSWTLNPRIVWTSRAGLDRVHEAETTNIPSISSFNASLPSGASGLSALYQQANGIDRMPAFYMNGAALAAATGGSNNADLYDQCCINTTFGHTLFSYSSQLVISRGTHLIKVGGEQRLFYNNFFQPPDPSGVINFSDYVTSPTPNSETDASGNLTGNPFASLLYGYADNVNPYPSEPTSLIVYPSVANKSKETGFYIQDDWKITPKLTLNLGLRYEWSTPYDERYNHLQFSDFTADTGVAIDLTSVPAAAPAGTSSAQAAMQSVGLNLPSSQELYGTTVFANSSMRSVPVYRNDIGPRFGFAYGINSKTVVRGGAGIYFGMSPATNFQYTGTAFRATSTIFFTQSDFANSAPLSTLANPFPSGFSGPQGKQYGALADWGYANNNDLGTTAARDADIYQWNLGFQRELPSQIVLGVDYVAGRSTHLPWSGTNNRNFIPSTLLAQVSAAVHYNNDVVQGNGLGNCDTNSCVSTFLQSGPIGPSGSNQNVGNPFYNAFTPPCGGASLCFNQPDSLYASPTVPLGNLLVPFPQFPATGGAGGDFEGLMLEEASSWYNALQIRFQKRATHNVSFEGSYTISKSTDDSSAGRNNWVGSLSAGLPQQLDRLNLEHSISANDTPQRLALAVVVDLPVGRKQLVGGNMNRALDAVVGGWSVAAMITEQSGQPLAISDSFARLANGSQRPNIVCPQLRSNVSVHDVALNWQQNATAEGNGNAPVASMFNSNCFADPGDQIPGNGPRYYPGLRTDGIHNFDMNIYKSFEPKEGMKIDLRAEIFNVFNHARFAAPDTGYGDTGFGTITSTAPGYLPRYFQFGLRFEF